ncbi:MAG: hypothetical protein Q9184_001225 [Pyrenodesmia sp. 2 TL-2023]
MAPKKRAKQDPFGSTTTSDRNDGKYSLRDLPSERPFATFEPQNASAGTANAPLPFGNAPVQSGLPDLTPILMDNAASNLELDDSQPTLEELEAAPTIQPPLFQPPSTQFNPSLTNLPAVSQPPFTQLKFQQAPVLAPNPEPRGIVEVLKNEIEELKKDKAHKAWEIADLQKLKISLTEHKDKEIQKLQRKVNTLQQNEDHYIAERNELKACKDQVIEGLREEMKNLDEEAQDGREAINERDLTIVNQTNEMAEMKAERRNLLKKYNGAILAKDEDIAKVKAERDAIQNGQGKEFVDNHNRMMEAKNEEIAKIKAERDALQQEKKATVEERDRMIYAQSDFVKIKAECDSSQNERKKLIEEHHQIIESKNQEIAKITAERDSLQNEGNKLLGQHHQMIRVKNEEIAKITAERASFEEQVRQITVDAEEQDGVVKANKQEIAKLTTDLKAVSEERDSLKQKWGDVGEKLTEASDHYEALKEKEEKILERDRKLGLQDEQIAELRSRHGMGVSEFTAVTEEYREKEDAQSEEIARLERELQKAMNKDKASTSTAEELKKTLENRDTELTECHRKMAQLLEARTKWRREVNELKNENASASRLLGSQQKGSHVDLVNQIQQLKISHDAKVAELEKCDQQRTKEAEAAKQTLTFIEEVKEGLEADVGSLQKRVEESRQKTTDLQQELEAYKRNVVTISQTTKDATGHVRDHPSPQLFPTSVTDQPSPQLFPASDELSMFSPSRFRRGRRGRRGGMNQGDGMRTRVPASRWGYGDQRSDDYCWSTDEDADREQQIQQPQPLLELDREKSTLSFEKDTEEGQPAQRRRRQSIEEHMGSMSDASTQTDALSPTSGSAIQAQPNDKPAIIKPSMQNKPKDKRAYAEMGTPTMPEDKPAMPASKPATTDMGTPTIPASKAKSKPAMADCGTQTEAVKKYSSLCWRILYYLLCLLAFILFLMMLSHGESSRRERDMWLEANDYTRRAVVSVRAGGGTGTRVPPWIWKEPLIEMPNSYY